MLAILFSGEHIGKMEIASDALALFGMYVSGRTPSRVCIIWPIAALNNEEACALPSPFRSIRLRYSLQAF